MDEKSFLAEFDEAMKELVSSINTDQDISGIIQKMSDIVHSKHKTHGLECWKLLGNKGLFVEINQKFWRLKRDIWDGVDCKEDDTLNTLRDLANYCVIMLANIRMAQGGKAI